jgi:hypothetical protein
MQQYFKDYATEHHVVVACYLQHSTNGAITTSSSGAIISTAV